MQRTALIITLVCTTVSVARADNWPQWRGPAGIGVTAETALPERWGDAQSIAWRARLRGMGVSTPVVWGDHVVATSQVGTGRRGPITTNLQAAFFDYINGVVPDRHGWLLPVPVAKPTAVAAGR